MEGNFILHSALARSHLEMEITEARQTNKCYERDIE
jgi:hypothetical protein